MKESLQGVQGQEASLSKAMAMSRLHPVISSRQHWLKSEDESPESCPLAGTDTGWDTGSAKVRGRRDPESSGFSCGSTPEAEHQQGTCQKCTFLGPNQDSLN